MERLDIHIRWQGEYNFYQWFFEGKTHDLRALSDFFNSYNIKEGLAVRVYKGNTEDYFDGTIGEVIVDSLDKILEKIGDYRKIAPYILSEEKFKEGVKYMLGNHPEYIAFEIIKD